MEQKKHYLVYKTTCLLNGKIYIGQHQTYDPNDDYLGSGKELRRDISKFGHENFKREILFDFDSQKEMDDKEKELVTEEFVARSDTYNIRVGGQNPEMYDLCNIGTRIEAKMCRDDPKHAQLKYQKISAKMKLIWKTHPERFGKRDWFAHAFMGHHHSEASKQKMREKNTHLLRGERNGSFGTVWIYNESLRQNKKVKKNLVVNFLKDGWKIGRKMSF